jgi:pilus assembly protein Flp/PilA
MVQLFQTLHTLSYVAADRVADRMRALKDDDKGASAVEYAILVGAIALAVVIAVAVFAGKLKTAFDNINLSPAKPS